MSSVVRNKPDTPSAKKPVRRRFPRPQNSFFYIDVSRPHLEKIGTKQVEFYEVSSRTNYEGFQVHVDIIVQRRYSEFQTLRAVLVAKGAKPLSLSWFQWIPKNLSRWEELNTFCEHLGKISRKFNDECIEELKRFCEDKSPYQAQEEPHTGLGVLRRLFI